MTGEPARNGWKSVGLPVLVAAVIAAGSAGIGVWRAQSVMAEVSKIELDHLRQTTREALSRMSEEITRNQLALELLQSRVALKERAERNESRIDEMLPAMSRIQTELMALRRDVERIERKGKESEATKRSD